MTSLHWTFEEQTDASLSHLHVVSIQILYEGYQAAWIPPDRYQANALLLRSSYNVQEVSMSSVLDCDASRMATVGADCMA